MSGVGRLAKLPSGRIGKWVVVGVWLVALFVLAPLGGKLTSVEDNQSESWLPASSETAQVLKAIEQVRSSNELPAVLVYEKPGGLTQADLATITQQAGAIGRLDGVNAASIKGPLASGEQPLPQAAQLVVPINVGTDGWDKLPALADKIKEIGGKDIQGATFYLTGPVGLGADQAKAFSGIDGSLLYSAIAVVMIVLLLTYRSPVLWLLPLVSAGAALMAAQGVIYLLAKHAGLSVNGQSAGILTVLVFGAATDYALLLVARYREELRRHKDRHEAMAFGLHRAGPAIWASALTVIIGMLCLAMATLNSTAGLGPVAAIGIGVGLLAMVTLLPALLAIFPRGIFWPKRPAYGSNDPVATGVWARVGKAIARRPRVVWMATSVVLIALALGTFTLKADGISDAGSFTHKPDSVTGQQVLAKHFPAGAGQPIQVVANQDAAAQVQQALQAVQGVDSVAPSLPPSGGHAYLAVTTKDAPDSAAANETLLRLRDAAHQVPGADALVGAGSTGVRYDVETASTHDRNLIIPIVLVVVFLILALLLRALIAPLLLIATVVLSYFTAIGISAFIFTHLFHFEGADASFPLFVFVFLVALGIDYNIFLMTRVREEALQVGTRRGALTGLSATGGVITSAGLVLAGTFAVLATLPVTAFAEIGFAVALGVIIDTTIVRAVLVTALTLDVGKFVWWPHKLSKNEDIVLEDSDAEQAVAVH